MKIAVDVDGVILAMIPKVCEVFNRMYNTNYTKNDVKQWEFFRDWNVSEKIIYKIFDKVYENSHTLHMVDENASYVLKKLFNTHKIDLLTARNIRFEHNLIKRLNSTDIRKGTHYEQIIHVSAKPYDSKLAFDYDIIIDDNPNLVDAIRKYENKQLLLYDQPWNQGIKENTKIKRVYNWNQIESSLSSK